MTLWPPPPESTETFFDTVDGPLKVWVLQRAARVSVVAEDVQPKEVEVDLVISTMADEPLISDKLAGALEIALEDIAEGL